MILLQEATHHGKNGNLREMRKKNRRRSEQKRQSEKR